MTGSKKSLDCSLDQRRRLVCRDQTPLSVSRQCELLGLHRSGLFYEPRPVRPQTLLVMRLMDAFGGRTSTESTNDGFSGIGGQAGTVYDAEAGLVLMTHRYYDPATGRFLTRDPIGYAGGVNLYGYTGNNSVNRVDPSGHNPVVVAAIIIAGGGPEDPVTVINYQTIEEGVRRSEAAHDCGHATIPGRIQNPEDGTLGPILDISLEDLFSPKENRALSGAGLIDTETYWIQLCAANH